jgi:hypothetical protein
MKRCGPTRPIPTQDLLERGQRTAVGIAQTRRHRAPARRESASIALAARSPGSVNHREERHLARPAGWGMPASPFVALCNFRALSTSYFWRSPNMTDKNSDKIAKTEAEWRQQLTPEQYQVARACGTERAFTGSIGTSTTTGHTTASAVARCCLARKLNLIRERDGRAFSPPPTARTSPNTPTPAMA